jgi:hypothetical protein
MDRQNNWRTRLRVALLVGLASSYLVPSFGCVDRLVGVTGTLSRQFNPCGTILVCDPLEWEYAVGNVDPFNPDFEECPLSTNAADCLDGAWPPLAGGGGGNGGGEEPAPQTVQ